MHLAQPVLHKIKHGGELAEHNALGTGVVNQHVVDLLSEGFQLGAALESRNVDATQNASLLEFGHHGACC